MHTRLINLTGAAIALIVGLCLAPASGASAAPFTASHITSPADASYFIGEPPAVNEMTISGTVEGSAKPGTVEIHCDSAHESTEPEFLEEEELTKTGPGTFSFSVKVPVTEIGEEPCVLRAVPENQALLTPGTATPFEGPRVANSEFVRREDAADKTFYAFEVEARTLGTYFEIDAAGGCGLGPTRLFSTPGLVEGTELFHCAGGLIPLGAGATRAAIQVDGRNAYDPETADGLVKNLPIKPAGTAPTLTVTKSFDETNGLKSIHEEDPLVLCKGATIAYPETSQSCQEFVPAGITLERTWTITGGGRLITMADAWHSTGAARALNVLYSQQLFSDTISPGTYEFPGSAAAFAPTGTGESIPLSAGEGAILYREAGNAEETQGALHPLAAITFDTSPSGPAEVTAGTAEAKGQGSLRMPFSFEVPKEATRKLTMSFAEGYTLTEVCELAIEAKSGCQPSVAISSPSSGTTTGTSSVSVSGTAGDVIGLTSVTVNGQPVAVTGGAWSATVALAPGANQIAAVATNTTGLKRSVTSTVTYLAPQPPGPAPPGQSPPGQSPPPAAQTPRAIRVGAAKLVKRNIAIILACQGPAGTTCAVKATLTTVEKVRGGRPSSLAAKTRTVTIGTLSASIGAGTSRTVTIRLNAAGRALLARFHRLPLHLVVVQQGVPAAAAAVAAQNLTVLAKRH